MNNNSPDNPELLNEFCLFLSNSMGLNFEQKNHIRLLKMLSPVTKTLGFKDIESCMKHLMHTPLTKRHTQILANALTIGETYFFREKTNLHYLQCVLIPNLIKKKTEEGCKRLKIWSSGCSTGEEPYTLAILLHQIIPDLPNWNITIFGTDINEKFLMKARTGTYSNWSFRTTPPEIKRSYFRPTNAGTFVLKEDFRSMVDFFYLNLVDISACSLFSQNQNFDIILCHNVLIYFSPQKISKVVQSLYNALSPQGYLFVTAVEAPFVNANHFRKLERAFGYQKTITQPTPRPHLPPILDPTPSKKQPSTNINKQKISALYQKGLYDAVINEIKKYAPHPGTIPHSIIDYIHFLVYSLANLGKDREALEWCEKAIAQDKLNPKLYCLQATLLIEMQRDNEAVPALKRAIFLDPDFVIANFTLGSIMLKNNDTPEASRYLRNTADILLRYNHDEILPGTETITADQLKSLIKALRAKI